MRCLTLISQAHHRINSITPVLSRVMEKIVVRELIYPAIQIPNPHLDFSDQFAFRPTGSTTAAIITILQSDDHNTLVDHFVCSGLRAWLQQGIRYRPPSNVLRKVCLTWSSRQVIQLSSQLLRRKISLHSIRRCNIHARRITASIIIQGSSLGPAAYIVEASDLKTVHPENKIPKFADDTYLIVGSSQAATNVEELENVENWAKRNNLNLNHSKSAEMVFTNPLSKTKATPPPPSGIPRVESLKVLGVTLTDSFSMTEHVTNTISSCAQALYALRMLNFQGLNQASLQLLFSAIILAKLQYASPAWIGFASASDINKLDLLRILFDEPSFFWSPFRVGRFWPIPGNNSKSRPRHSQTPPTKETNNL